MVQQKPTQPLESLQDHLNTLQQLVNCLPQTVQQSDQLRQAFEDIQSYSLQLRITEEKRYQTEYAFRTAIEHSVLAGIIVIDSTGRQTYANPNFCRMVGWDEAELIGAMPPFVYWAPDAVEQTTQIFQSILTHRFSSQGIELYFQRRNGEAFQALLQASPQTSLNGDIVGWVISVDDITEHRQTEESLRYSEARFQRLISNMPGMVYRYLPCASNSDTFMYVNSGSHELFEVDPDQVLENASCIWKLIHPDDFQSLQESIAIAVEHSLPWKWEGRIITPSGQIKWIQGNSRPEKTNQGEVWDGLLIDITDRKRTEEQLRASLQEKEVLLQEIHHRVKNNLQIVSSLLDLQASQLTDPQAHEALKNSRCRIESMALVHNSLYRSRNLAAVNFSEYVHTLVTSLFRTYNVRQDRITLRVSIDPDLTLNLDQAVPCGLILSELMTNALRHGFHRDQEGEVFVQAKITRDQEMTLIVGNNGNKLPLDFEIQSIKSMGLKLVTILVKQLKGSIAVSREKYTEFAITLPCLI